MYYLFKGKSVLENPISHLLVHAIGLPGLCSDRSLFSPYDLHIRLNDISSNKIHLVLGIPSFLDFFD